MKLSVVVPCYNEEANIIPFYDAISTSFAKKKKLRYELIFINDGSKDKTGAQLNTLLKEKKGMIKIIEFSRNFGKEAAIYAGLKAASGEFVSIIDVDLQQNPSIILDMLSILEKKEEVDVVAAYQENRIESKSLIFYKKCFYRLINAISSVPFVQGASDFRTFRKPVVDAILEVGEYHRFSKGIFSFVGFQTLYIPYQVEERKNGTSKWNFIKLFRYAIEGIVAFTTAPLRLSFFLALITLSTSLLSLIIFCIMGMSSLAMVLILLLFFMGLQFLCIGFIGEYLAKTYIEGKKRPLYIVKSIKESKEK